ncbi:hypothetical protein B0J18DRAFT_70563 [Chaetomium sp. MPI-SDFR-AT-0129]|nr:hypothetical protein B0J18DRAFT_70563 [Chaetomium sp. MPI-SDFR-AT-0129]
MPTSTPPTPTPELKKKPSFRDRLRAWQKSPPRTLEIVTEEAKPRFVYEPTHAAADFSRLAVSPQSPSRHRSATTQTWPRSKPSGSQKVPIQADDKGESEPTARASQSGTNSRSHTLTEGRSRGATIETTIPTSNPSIPQSAVAPSRAPELRESPSTQQPQSDYELFIARAEAEERERRKLAFHGIPQRGRGYTAANAERPGLYPQRPVPVPITASSPVRETPGRVSQQPDQTRPNRTTCIRGTEEKPPGHDKHQDGRGGYGRQSSQMPGHITAGTGSAAVDVSNTEIPIARPVVTSGLGDARKSRELPQRTLRRQASLTKRITQYIRPAKTAAERAREALVE